MLAVIAAASAFAPRADASFHLFRIEQIFSNADGTVQFVVLHESFGANGEQFLGGQHLTVTHAGVVHDYTFPNNLPSSSTAGRRALIATQGFAALGIVTPDYVIPNNFLPMAGGTLNYAGVDVVNYASLPTDGTSAVDRNGNVIPNVATNFAGQHASVLAPVCMGFVLDAQGVTVAGPGGPHSVAVHGANGCGWTAVANVPWLAITAGASGSGEGTVSYVAQANPGLSERIGTMTIAGHTFTVTQLPGAGGMHNRADLHRRIDFNGDGKTDLLWRHTDGSSYIWLMNGTNQVVGAPLLGAGSGWSVVQVGDFNGDGKTDLVWQHTDGSSYLWLMDGTSQIAGAPLLPAGSGWSVVQVGDFNGDGKTDLLWQHTDGSTYIWLMDGTNQIVGAPLLPAGTGWSVVQVGDFNGDGKSDLLWQHADGSTYIWLMDGTSQIAGASLLPAGSGWSVVQVGDLDGDGKSDLVWQHTDGGTYAWLMNGTAQAVGAPLLGAGSGWTVTELGDFNGDGKADLVWQHTDGGTYTWLMNGTAQSVGSALLGAGSGWSVGP